MEQLIETSKKASQGALDRQMQRRFLHVARIMSGELDGFGAKVSKIDINDQNRACTDGKLVSIPSDLDADPRINLIMQEAVLAHEVAGHHRYTDFVAWNNLVVQESKAGRCDPMLHDFTNIIEDARINHLLSQDFPGSGKRMDFTHDIFMGRHQSKTDENASLKQQAMVAIMSECIAHKPHWSTAPEVIDFMDEARPILTNAIRQPDTTAVVKQAKRLIKLFRTAFPEDDNELDPTMGDFDMSGESESQSEVEQAAREQQNQGRNPERVSKNRFDEMPSLEEQAEKEAAKNAKSEAQGEESEECDSDSGDAGSEGEEAEGDGDGDESGAGGLDSDSDSDSDSDGEGEGDADTAGGDAEANQGNGDEVNIPNDGEHESELFEGGRDYNPEGDADSMTELKEHYANLIADAHNEMMSMNDAAIEDEVSLKEDAERAIDSVGTEKIRIEGHAIEIVAGASDMFHHDYDYHRMALDNGLQTYDSAKLENNQGIRILSEEIKRQLKGRNSRNQTGLKRGRVNNKDIWKVNQTGAKMFKKKLIPKKVEASAIILIDSSGSMGGTKATCAAKAAVVFSEVMETCGVDFEVIDFSTSYGSSLRVRKPLGGRLGATEKSVIASPTAGGCNADGYCVQWAIDRLMARSGSKMLFVLSDGQPTDGGPSGMDASEWLKKVVRNCPKEIATVGVGIQSNAVSRYYPNHVVIQNPNELPDKMIPIMRPMLKRMVQ